MESRQTPNTPGGASPRPSRRVTLILGLVVVLALAGGVSWWTGLGSYLSQRREYGSRTNTFSGSSESLTQTVIVPTLDSPCPPGRNVIWCSSFQLAWNELRDKVVGGPLKVPEAADLAARLNVARQSASDLDAQSVYAAAGYVEQGIRETIRREMTARFPSHALPDFNDFNGGIFSYSYLTARVPFKYPFRQLGRGLAFTDSQGAQTQVDGFGLWEAYLSPYENMGKQVEVLYQRSEDPDGLGEPKEYALDLCRHSRPYQVVVASVERRGSLAETLEFLRAQMEDFKSRRYYEVDRWLHGADELEVPDMFWRIDHRFRELTGRLVANTYPPMPIVEALQTIEFRLDRSGAVLETQATTAIAAIPRAFVFNRPFLIYMQRRGAAHPFFVMWVDNAELLVRK